MKISSDLCEICQQNNNLIMKSVNCSEAEKTAQLVKQEQHLVLVKNAVTITSSNVKIQVHTGIL